MDLAWNGGFASSFPNHTNYTTTQTVWDNLTGTTATSGTTAGVFGSWAQLVASAPIDIGTMVINIFDGGNSRNGFVNIGVGGSGSEQIIIPNLVHSAATCTRYMFSVNIPAGTRIAIQSANAAAGAAGFLVTTTYFSGHCWEEAQVLDSIGAGVGIGTAVTSSATAGTYGSFAQLVASTANDYRGFYVMFDSQGGTMSTSASGKAKIAVGGSGSEVAIFDSTVVTAFRSCNESSNAVIVPFWVQVPAGQRLSAAFECTLAATTTCGVSLIGIR